VSFTIIDVPQRSNEWHAARIGRLTSSRANDMLTELKSGKGEAAGRRNLRMLLALERVTGKPQERGFQSAPMQHGAEKEEAAYAAYEALTGEMLTRTGFLSHDSLMAGASLDGHVGNFEGLIEIKAPLPATHWEYLRSGKVPTDYYRQVLHSLWLTGAAWCDWMSFCDEFPANLQSKIVRVNRVEAEIAEYDTKARAFLAEVDAEVNAVNTLSNLSAQLEASVGY
jgi:hypothetical protein